MLISMPWARVSSPALGVGLLKAILVDGGHDAHAWYVNLELADRLGPNRYRGIVNGGGLNHGLLGEWLFSRAAFGDKALPTDRFLDQHPEALTGVLETPASLRELHESVLPDFVEELAGSRDWSTYDLVGFSTTFEQNVASLALARAIKQRHEDTTIVFGGANVDGGMGPAYLNAIDWIDITVSGEADTTICQLAAAVHRGDSLMGMPGVWFREGATIHHGGEQTLTRDLDALPTPDYAEYFSSLDAMGERRMLSGRVKRLTFESSRGCWWGAKHHCTFCGLNALGMAYRSKSPQRVVTELTELAREYQVLTFEGADNIIDHAGMDELCSRLALAQIDWDLFYEVKANLTRDQVAALANAGIRTIQPGIESLSTRVLGLMRKGSSLLINLRLLKWARAERMRVIWTILAGFPGETDEDYAAQAALIPLLHHLQPPDGVARLLLERFSPYFDEPDHGFTDVRPLRAYASAYPIPQLDHAAIAYAFEYSAAPVASAAVLTDLKTAVRTWQEAWTADGLVPQLRGLRGPGWTRILDSRSGAVERTTLTGAEAALLASIDETYRGIPAIARRLRDSPTPLSESQVEEGLKEFVDRGFVVMEGGHALSLVLSPSPGSS